MTYNSDIVNAESSRVIALFSSQGGSDNNSSNMSLHLSGLLQSLLL